MFYFYVDCCALQFVTKLLDNNKDCIKANVIIFRNYELHKDGSFN